MRKMILKLSFRNDELVTDYWSLMYGIMFMLVKNKNKNKKKRR